MPDIVERGRIRRHGSDRENASCARDRVRDRGHGRGNARFRVCVYVRPPFFYSPIFF